MDDQHNEPEKIWTNMTPDQIRAYIESTKARRSRKKPRPSLDKHRAFLDQCVEGGAVMSQVFDDLIAKDRDVLDEFGPNGHRAFNAYAKRMFGT